MQRVSAADEHDRSSNAPRTYPKSNADRSLRNIRCWATNYKLLFCRLTPELSRAERDGWEPVLLAHSEVSKKPRNGVGLNDLLGGPDAGEGEAMANLPKAEARMLERAP